MGKNYKPDQKRKGQDAGEWALIIGAVAIVVMTTLFALAPSIKNMWSQIDTALTQEANQ